MGHSQAEKANSRERILSAAAQQIRESGLEALSVGGLMKSVSLTHGGFYNHFSSRNDLIVAALERALSEGDYSAPPSGVQNKIGTFSALAKSYLSRAHRDSRATGCAIAALASDVARSESGAREVMEDHVEQFIDEFEDALGDQEAAMVAISTMVGALILSRVVTDPKRSDAILKSARSYVLALDAASAQG